MPVLRLRAEGEDQSIAIIKNNEGQESNRYRQLEKIMNLSAQVMKLARGQQSEPQIIQKSLIFQGFSGWKGTDLLILIRPCPIHHKQIRMGNRAHIIWILFIIRKSAFPGWDVAIVFLQDGEQRLTDEFITACLFCF